MPPHRAPPRRDLERWSVAAGRPVRADAGRHETQDALCDALRPPRTPAPTPRAPAAPPRLRHGPGWLDSRRDPRMTPAASFNDGEGPASLAIRKGGQMAAIKSLRAAPCPAVPRAMIILPGQGAVVDWAAAEA